MRDKPSTHLAVGIVPPRFWAPVWSLHRSGISGSKILAFWPIMIVF